MSADAAVAILRETVIDPHVIVLEDDPELRSLLTRGLREEGFEVTTAGTASEMLDLRTDEEPDAMIVDVGLPDADGRDLVQALRARGTTAPIIFLTARDALPDRLAGFAAGGDDYLTKPFAFAELVARLHALMKRAGSDLSVQVGRLAARPGHPRRVLPRRDRRPYTDRIPHPGAPRRPSGRRGATATDRRGRLAARGDRPRQHPRRVHRPTATQARSAPGRTGDRDGARRRLLVAMRGRRFRLGVRTRLLLTVAGAVSIALVIGVTAFNLLLDQRLTDSEIALAQGQATAEASALQVVDGQLVTPERPDEGVKIGSPVWVFAGKRPLESPRVAPSLDALARSLADGPERTVRVKEEIRLYALPVLHDGARVGTVVAGVPLEPYDETATIAFVGSIALAVLLLGAVTLLTRWILGKALLPVSRMTEDAATWSDHDLDQRFDRGEPYDELTQLAATLDALLERLSASIRHEQRFASELSHELRTPLARIAAETELALHRERSSSDYRASLEAVHRNAEQMTRTVDALISVARLEAGLSRATSDARDAIENAAESVHDDAKRRGSRSVSPSLPRR